MTFIVLHEQTPGFSEHETAGVNWIGGSGFSKAELQAKYGSNGEIYKMSDWELKLPFTNEQLAAMSPSFEDIPAEEQAVLAASFEQAAPAE